MKQTLVRFVICALCMATGIAIGLSGLGPIWCVALAAAATEATSWALGRFDGPKRRKASEPVESECACSMSLHHPDRYKPRPPNDGPTRAQQLGVVPREKDPQARATEMIEELSGLQGNGGYIYRSDLERVARKHGFL